MPRKSHFQVDSERIERHLSEVGKARTVKEIADGLGKTTSSVYTTLQLMEVFGTVQKVKRGSYYYFLKGDYTEEQIKAMLSPEEVKSKPRYSTVRRRSGGSVRRSFLDEHLSAMREQAGSGEGPSALAMIGLTQEEMTVEEALTEELPAALEVVLFAEAMRAEDPTRVEAFGTVELLPKTARRLNVVQTRRLKGLLKGLDGFGGVERFETAFAEFSALENGNYGNVFYFSMGTNPWERVYRVMLDDPLPFELVEPVEVVKKLYKSKYNVMIDSFIELGRDMASMTVEGKEPSYVAAQLRRRVEARGLEITVETANGLIYLKREAGG